jgi:DNA-binding transcriptional LysR family regulator
MRADIDTNLLRAFLAAADAASFTAAARALNRTQSAVSMQIKRLEETIGGQLFDRGGRRIELTGRGEALITYARHMVALNDEAIGKLRGDALEGVVRFGLIEDYAMYVLPALLARFLSAHPSVAVEAETAFTPVLMERLGKPLDLVLAMHPDGTGKGEILRRERAVWAGAREHAVHEQAVLPLALHPPGCQFRQAALSALDRAKRHWRLAYVSTSLGAVEAATCAGLAITVTKTGTLSKELVALGPKQGLPVLPSFEIALHRARRSGNRAAAALFDYLATALRDGTA